MRGTLLYNRADPEMPGVSEVEPKQMADKLQGECLCGGVKFEITGPEVMGACHCTRCQRWTGGGANMVLVVPEAGFNVTAGKDLIKVYKTEGKGDRSFCSTCGSCLYGGGGGKLYVGAGTVRTEHGMTPMFHVMVAYKLPWDHIPEGATQFPEFPPGM